MDREHIVAKIMGFLCACTGAFMIGNWWAALGVVMMLAGYNMMTVPMKLGKPKVVKDWLGNEHLE